MSEQVVVLVAEKSPSLAGLLVDLLEQSNFEALVATSEAEALELVKSRHPQVVLSSVSRFDGEGLCRTLRKHHRELPVALIYPPSRTDDIGARAQHFGADLVLVGPVQKASLLSAVKLLVRLRRLSRQLAEAEGQAARDLAREDDGPQPLDLPTFKRMLNLEVKKSRRYRFPASFLLVQLDPESIRGRKLDRAGHAKLIGATLAALTKGLRDIDLCVHTGSDRFIVFLPHTPNAGAQVVAARLHERLRALAEPPLTSSIGVAAYEGQGPISFGSLLRDATLALKRAREAGGDRVELANARTRDRVFIA